MRFQILWVFVVIVGLSQYGKAQEKKPWWQPFGSSSSAEAEAPVRSSDYFNKSEGPNFKFPSLGLGNLFSGKKQKANSGSKDAVRFASGSSDSSSTKRTGSAKGLTGVASATGSFVEQSGQGVSRNWKRLTRSSKQAWDSTTDFLNPFNDGKKKKSAMPRNLGYQPQQMQPKKSGMFDWLVPPPAEPEPETLGDFLKMSRPSF